MTSSLEEITLRNQIESPLLRLPGELRNRICELAVSGNIIVVSSSYKRPGKMPVYLTSAETPGPIVKGAQKSDRTSVSGIFTIGLACRQLHQETALTQYTKNTFHFDDEQTGRTFVEGLTSAQRALLTSISINFYDYFKADCWCWDFVTHTWEGNEGTRIFLPELKRVYIKDDKKIYRLVNEEDYLRIFGQAEDRYITQGRCLAYDP